MEGNKYLGNEILAVCDDWVVVYDGKYNYYLFNIADARIMKRKQRGWMPSNMAGARKQTEYYTTFSKAANNLCKVAANGGFFNFTRSLDNEKMKGDKKNEQSKRKQNGCEYS